MPANDQVRRAMSVVTFRVKKNNDNLIFLNNRKGLLRIMRTEDLVRWKSY